MSFQRLFSFRAPNARPSLARCVLVLNVALLLALTGLVASPAFSTVLILASEAPAEESERSVEVSGNLQLRPRRVCYLHALKITPKYLLVANAYAHDSLSPTPVPPADSHLIGSGIRILC